MKHDYRILLVEDEPHMVTTVEFVLGGQYVVQSVGSVGAARKLLYSDPPDLALLDLGLPDENGIVLLREIRKRELGLDVILLTGSKDVGLAVEAMKLGALDYVQKPFEKEDLLLCVKKAFERWKLTNEVERLRSELKGQFLFSGIIANSHRMKQALAVARKMADSEATVLITGESGTGKELVARAIHWEGRRNAGPFVAINCAQFSGTLLESELFGHEKGAFTGAVALHKGRFELANTGTLFLDEVGNTSLEMQAKILRVVETKSFERVGGHEPIQVDVRLLAATNADLETEIQKGRFREDLYYRLNVVKIEMPPLRERKEDIPVLCEHLLARQRARTGRTIRGITPEATDALMSYDWKGNVRELQNLLEMTVALEEGEWITTRYFPMHILACAGRSNGAPVKGADLLDAVMGDFERRFLIEQLRVNGWNRRKTARSLGIHRNTIENKLKKYGIRDDDHVRG
jgi:DNA-binding NtrC family response regulator